MPNRDIYGIDIRRVDPIDAEDEPPRSPLAASPQRVAGGVGGAGSHPWWMFQTPDLFNDGPFRDDQWLRHHSWLRHLPEPRRFSLVALGLLPVISWIVAVTTAVGLYAELLQPKPGWPVAVSRDYIQPFVLTSFAASLLLVFRTTSSYDRWWEARKAFGLQYNYVRNIARMTLAWMPPEEEALARDVVRWDSALCASACAFLREDPAFLDPGACALAPAELEFLRNAQQPPVAALQVISALLKRSSLSVYERAAVEEQLGLFDISLGALERIRSQTIPLAYTRHTSRFIITFLTFLPFGLWSFTGWLTIPTMAAITFLLVGIENIGIQIEQPLWNLPLASFAWSCRRAAEAVVAEATAAQKLAHAAGQDLSGTAAAGGAHASVEWNGHRA